MFRYIKDLAYQATTWAIKAIVARMRDPLIARATKTPYFHLVNDEGDPYMLRYWLVPYTYKGSHSEDGCGPVGFFQRPLAWMFQKLGIAIRVHCIMRSDSDRAVHDHPWDFVTVLLDGAYYEHRPVYDDGLYAGDSLTRYEAGSILFRRAADLHRLELPEGQMVWTLFITGPRKQSWGFVENLAYKKYYRDYLAMSQLEREAEHAEQADDYNYEAGVLLDFIVNGFGATEDHRLIEAMIRKESVVPLSDEQVAAIMRRIVAPEPASLVRDLDPTLPPRHAVLAATDQRTQWLLASCKECGYLTYASKWYLPREAALMTKEHSKLEAEGRYPFTGVKERGAPMCLCDADKPIAHRVSQ